MKLLINASTLSGTGVTQVAVSFINECINFPENEYHVLLSKTVSRQLNKSKFPSNFVFYDILSHPLYGINGFKIRRSLKKITSEINPDCIFSVFGPSWWTPNKPHVLGYAYPHYVYPDSPFFSRLNIFDKVKIEIFKKIHIFFLKRNGKYFITETEDVSTRLAKILNIEKKNVFTVSNTFSKYFLEYENSKLKILPTKEKGEFRLLSLCSLAPHKNLTILNEVIPILQKNKELNIKFILTVDTVLFEKEFNKDVKDSIINLGRVDIAKCPQLYTECDALFLPTTLECFTANYPESMKMQRPILTSNLSFATQICQNAAIYFDPYDPYEISNAIISVVNDSRLRESLVEKGNTQLKSFLTPKERAAKYLNICSEVLQKQNYQS